MIPTPKLPRRAIAVVAALLLAGAQDPDRVGDLPVGEHAVGFRTAWELDAGRRYATAFDAGATYGAGGRSPRPVLVELWYPREPRAGTTPMPYGGYFEIAPASGPVVAFARALAAYARGVLVEEVLGGPEAELSPARRTELERLLAAPTACVRDAAPATGPFPLVVYHSGAGSSFEDDSRFCEYLASHGYVVVGSAYPRADGSSLGIDGARGSAEDAQVLVRHAARLPFVDAGRVAFAGHSAGAQALLRAACQPDAAADVLVLLDTTLDYYSVRIPSWAELIEEVTRERERLALPMLVAAGPGAMFRLCDSLVRADRTYLTVAELGHDEFISQGLQSLEANARLARLDPPEGDAAEVARCAAVGAGYRALCEYVLLYLDVHLRDDAAAFDARTAEYGATALGGGAPHVERAEPGADGPPPWDPASDVLPSPRQVYALATTQSGAVTCELIARLRASAPESPILSGAMLWASVLHDLVLDGRAGDARAVDACLREGELDPTGTLLFLADMARMTDHPDREAHFARVAGAVAPEDERVVARLAAVAAAGGVAAPGTDPAALALAFTGGRWYDGERFVPGERWSVGGVLRATAPERVDATIDLGGRCVVPPYGEAHAHLLEPDAVDDVVAHFLRRGVFYVRDQGRSPSVAGAYRAACEGPTTIDLVSSNQAFTSPGGHPLELVAALKAAGFLAPGRAEESCIEVASLEDLERAWPGWVAGGPDFVELVLVHSEHHAERRQDPAFFGRRGLDPALVAPLVRRAHEAGYRVAAHTRSRADFRTAVEAGVDMLTHLPGAIAEPGEDEASLALEADDASAAAERGVVVATAVGTVAGAPAPIDDERRAYVERVVRANLALLRAAGVTIVLGGDGLRSTTDLEATVLLGLGLLEPADLLRAWCVDTPRSVLPKRRVGGLADGDEASFLVLAGDPLEDFANASRIVLRVKEGRLLFPRDVDLPPLPW